MFFLIRVLLLGAPLLFIASTAHADLIINPGNDVPLAGGEIFGWTEAAGSNWTQRMESPEPQAGNAYFFPGADAFAELTQNIDVSTFSSNIDAGVQQFDFSGYMRSFTHGLDSSQIILEFKTSTGIVLGSFDSGQIINPTAWQLVEDSRIAPVNTRQIELRLLSVRNAGTNNDGYFDSLSLTTTAIPEPSSLVCFGIATAGVFGARRRRRAANKIVASSAKRFDA